jgi:ATP-dependent exoDNAse (exonuclease V) alpha subunit
MHRGLLGTASLNTVLQQLLNPAAVGTANVSAAALPHTDDESGGSAGQLLAASGSDAEAADDGDAERGAGAAVAAAAAAQTRIQVGDRVMQMKNNYSVDVVNGSIGWVVAITDAHTTVRFDSSADNREVTYSAREARSQLGLAYATTVHKVRSAPLPSTRVCAWSSQPCVCVCVLPRWMQAQGSEWPVVVVTVPSSHFVMLSRQLLFTALSRAEKLVIMIGDKKVRPPPSHASRQCVRVLCNACTCPCPCPCA